MASKSPSRSAGPRRSWRRSPRDPRVPKPRIDSPRLHPRVRHHRLVRAVPRAAGPQSGPAAARRRQTVDLTPRTLTEPNPVPAAARARPRRRRWPAALVLALVLIGGAVILFEGLSNATVYFCNANEVGQRSDCMPGKRFRVQGTVDTGSVRGDGADTALPVRYGG